EGVDLTAGEPAGAYVILAHDTGGVVLGHLRRAEDEERELPVDPVLEAADRSGAERRAVRPEARAFAQVDTDEGPLAHPLGRPREHQAPGVEHAELAAREDPALAHAEAVLDRPRDREVALARIEGALQHPQGADELRDDEAG